MGFIYQDRKLEGSVSQSEREAKITLSERLIDTAESLLREIAEPIVAKNCFQTSRSNSTV
jgi:hypothetical protein